MLDRVLKVVLQKSAISMFQCQYRLVEALRQWNEMSRGSHG
jgi:hypothetical protein